MCCHPAAQRLARERGVFAVTIAPIWTGGVVAFISSPYTYSQSLSLPLSLPSHHNPNQLHTLALYCFFFAFLSALIQQSPNRSHEGRILRRSIRCPRRCDSLHEQVSETHLRSIEI